MAGVYFALGLFIGVASGAIILVLYHRRQDRKLRIAAANVEPVIPPKFRQRTAESDPNRKSRVRPARIRAIKYKRPDPRGGNGRRT